MIASARETAEAISHRSLITQTWELQLDSFPWVRELTLPQGPIQSINSISYIDDAGNTQTFNTDLVFLVKNEGKLVLKEDEEWPTSERLDWAVTFDYDAGYGTSETDVPSDLRLAILHHVSVLYENRGCGVPEVPEGVRQVYHQYRPFQFGDWMG